MLKKIIKNLFFLLGYPLTANLDKEASILMYHSVGDQNIKLSVELKSFEKQLNYLKLKRFNLIKLSELIKKIINQQDISNCVVLTFDDGYLSQYQQAFPLLKKYQIPATIFLITGLMGKDYKNSRGEMFPMLKLEQIKEMAVSNLVEFMPHTRHHSKLTEINPLQLNEELAGSREDLKNLLNHDLAILAYPKGLFSQTIIDYLKKNNWQGAVTIQPGLIDQQADPFTLKRNAVDVDTSFVVFKGLVAKTINYYQKLKNV